ncbi:MAG TPA: hypothetical protein PKD09_00720 [Aggregatilinea sp.]|uniref:hypothetical protein n=1 Tax=Aggregatilinea sp. TaxID=2806333 RepID=UPI002B6582F9|nr:hypothetical protein [Aggregatilinea sp.]HML20138.1 hypothetical protein [Aggregatilinea sp.]
MLQYQIETEQYWTEHFQLSNEDVEYIFSVFLEEETPLTSAEIAHRLIQYRISQEVQTLRRQLERGEIFQPRDSYTVGQKLIFPAMGYAAGEVVDARPGNNPEHGDFTVLRVTFEGGRTREFASALATPHTLNFPEDADPAQVTTSIDPDAIFDQFGDDVIYLIEERLREEPDVVNFAGRWFLRSLLVDIGIAQLHLAEAVLVMNEGGPLHTSDIAAEIDLPQEVDARLRNFSLDNALFHDHRFDEVGPAGQVLWFLHEMEPQEVTTVPLRLRYNAIEYNRHVLTEDLLTIENEIDDELSSMRSPARPADEVTFSLNFPHRRTGTLPLSSRLRHLFPTAYEAPHILMTLVDGQSGEEMQGWVVREHHYVYGLADFYRKYRLPVGTYLTVKRTDDPSRVIVNFAAHRPHTEWIRLAAAGDHQILFDNQKRAIGAEYDELMVLGADDLQGIDALWLPPERAAQRLPDIMRQCVSQLARLSPQQAVHAKTVYSAVNVILRCPPGPIFSTLVTRPEFEHVGGPYWRLS